MGCAQQKLVWTREDQAPHPLYPGICPFRRYPFRTWGNDGSERLARDHAAGAGIRVFGEAQPAGAVSLVPWGSPSHLLAPRKGEAGVGRTLWTRSGRRHGEGSPRPCHLPGAEMCLSLHPNPRRKTSPLGAPRGTVAYPRSHRSPGGAGFNSGQEHSNCLINGCCL